MSPQLPEALAVTKVNTVQLPSILFADYSRSVEDWTNVAALIQLTVLSDLSMLPQHLGNPKQPTISVCNLVDGEYQISKFRDNDGIISQTFPKLQLTPTQIFQAGLSIF